MSMTGPESFDTTIAPWLAVRDAQEAVGFYGAAFGAVETYRLDDDHGRVAVARLSVDGAEFWVQDDPDASPAAPGLGSVRMILSVGDPSAPFDFDHKCIVLDFRDPSVGAADRYYLISDFQGLDEFLLVLCFLLLRANQEEIKDNDHQTHRDHQLPICASTRGSRL